MEGRSRDLPSNGSYFIVVPMKLPKQSSPEKRRKLIQKRISVKFGNKRQQLLKKVLSKMSNNGEKDEQKTLPTSGGGDDQMDTSSPKGPTEPPRKKRKLGDRRYMMFNVGERLVLHWTLGNLDPDQSNQISTDSSPTEVRCSLLLFGLLKDNRKALYEKITALYRERGVLEERAKQLGSSAGDNEWLNFERQRLEDEIQDARGVLAALEDLISREF